MGAWALDPVATRQPQAVGQTFHLSLPLNGTGSSALADYDQGDLVALLQVQDATRPNWTAVDVINVGGVVSGTGRRARGAFNALAIVSRPDGLNVWMDNDVGLATLHSHYGVHEKTTPAVAKSFLSSAQFELDGEIAALPDGVVSGCQVETATLDDSRFDGASLQTCWVAVKITRVALVNRSTGRALRVWNAEDATITNFQDTPEAVIHLPDRQAMDSAYPIRAVRAGAAGDVALRCEMDQAGHFAGCHVISETPEGYGFAAAALRLADHMRNEPKSVGGTPTPSVVDFTITFRRPIREVFGEIGGAPPVK